MAKKKSTPQSFSELRPAVRLCVIQNLNQYLADVVKPNKDDPPFALYPGLTATLKGLVALDAALCAEEAVAVKPRKKDNKRQLAHG